VEKYRKPRATEGESIYLYQSSNVIEGCSYTSNSLQWCNYLGLQISNRNYSAILATLQITSYALGVQIALLFICQLHESLIKFQNLKLMRLKLMRGKTRDILIL
jgi:hypothetical protein